MMVYQKSENMRIYDECEKSFQERMTLELSEAIGKLSAGGVRLGLPDSVHELQVAWPEDCPFSEEGLRAELELILTEAKGIQADFKALQVRARKTLDKVPSSDLGDLPASIYYALTDGLASINDGGCTGFLDFTYAEGRLAATPESLRTEWLKRIFSPGLDSLRRPETKQRLEEILLALSGKDAGQPENDQLPTAREARGSLRSTAAHSRGRYRG